MPYTFTLTAKIPASAQEVYDAWLDSLVHSEMTGGEAAMSGEVGAEVSAWDGYITGRNLELVPGERIVQSWRTSEFEDEAEDSVITVTLEEEDGGTLLTLEHSNVPEEHRSYEQGGWQANYFEPMVAYFMQRMRQAPDAAAGEAEAQSIAGTEPDMAPQRATKTSPRRAAGKARKAKQAQGRTRKAKPAAAKPRKAKRAGAAKSARAAPRGKASAGKAKSKKPARSAAAKGVKRAKGAKAARSARRSSSNRRTAARGKRR